MLALLVSNTNHKPKPFESILRLLDFKGFLDYRYSVLAVGAVIAMLGQFIPYYYISKCTFSIHFRGNGLSF